MKNFTTIESIQFDCCVNCAQYYNFFFDFVCYKSINSKTSCLFCAIIEKISCVTIKFLHKSHLNELQKIIQTYFNVLIRENFEIFENWQKQFDKKLKNWRKYSNRDVHFINKNVLKKFNLHRIFKQQIKININFMMLRKLIRQHFFFDMCNSHHVKNLNFNKNHHLEFVVAHLIDRMSKKSCSNCEKKNSFKQCIVMNDQNDTNFLSDDCINYAYEKQQCYQNEKKFWFEIFK